MANLKPSKQLETKSSPSTIIWNRTCQIIAYRHKAYFRGLINKYGNKAGHLGGNMKMNKFDLELELKKTNHKLAKIKEKSICSR
jgi:hypothetical protein